MKIGTGTSPPFGYFNKESRTFEGLMIEAITAVAGDAGFEVEFQSLAPVAMIPALISGAIDISAGTLTTSAERRKVIAFSEPFTSYSEALVVSRSDTRDYHSLSEFKGKVVGVNAGSAYADLVTKAGATVQAYDAFEKIFAALSSGKIAAAIMNSGVVSFQLRSGIYSDLQAVKSYQPTAPAALGVAVRKSDEALLGRLNASIAKLEAEGVMRKIIRKWTAN